MALIKCLDSKTNSGKEVVLWTNSKPTSAFSSQSVTLTDSIFKFSMIRIEGRVSTSVSNKLEVYVRPQFLTSCSTNTESKGAFCLLIGSNGGGTANGSRLCRASSDDGTTLVFGTATYVNYTGTDNSQIIPTKVVGVY